jgi:peptide/nickel transport system substrate-binding protein
MHKRTTMIGFRTRGRARARFAALAVALALTLGGLGASSAAERPLRIGLVAQPNSLDPLHAVQFFENYLDEAIFSALTVIDDRGRVAPDLAERVPTRQNGDISPDGKTITYRLRSGVRWSDGAPLTSRDVAFTFGLMREPATNFPEASIYTIVDRIDTPDPRTVVLHLHSAWADATSQLFVGGQDGSIVPEHILRGLDENGRNRFEAAPLGSGPYTVERWDRGNDIVLRANPTYFGGRPNIERIEIDFVPDGNTLALRVRTGELDFSPQIPQSAAAQLRTVPGLRTLAVPTFNDLQLGFNTRIAPFTDVRVRRALLTAIDRTQIASAAYHGLALPADDLVPPQSPAYHRDPAARPDGDLAGAARLLAAAGYVRGPDGIRRKNGRPIAFALAVPSGYAVVVASAVLIQATWHALGVDASLKVVPVNVLLAPATGLLPSGNFEAYLATNGFAISPDRSDELTTSGLPPNGRNYPRYRNRDVDAWTAQARATLADGPRNALYAKISAQVRADAPLVPLVWQKQFYAFTMKLTGFRAEPVNSDLWNVASWRLGS